MVVLYCCFHAALTHFTSLCHRHTTYKVREGVKSNKSHDATLKYKSADEFLVPQGRRQNSLPLSTNFSHNVTEPSTGISYPIGDLCQRFTKLTRPCAYTLHSSPIPQQMLQMAFFDLLHTFHKQVTNLS